MLRNNEKGFTLIEVISVLVILGVLAMVAMPKYIDLIEQARESALDAALADGISTVSMNYAYLMLSNGGKATTAAIATRAGNHSPVSYDFSYTFTASAAGVDVAVGAKSAGRLGNYSVVKTKTWEKP